MFVSLASLGRSSIAALLLLTAGAARAQIGSANISSFSYTEPTNSLYVAGMHESMSSGAKVVDITGGWGTIAALREDQSFCVWGRNRENQCGGGMGSNINGLWRGTGIVRLGEGFGIALYIDPDRDGYGYIDAWGDNTYGQLNVPASGWVTQIAAGRRHALAIQTDGTVLAWGDNSFGQCNVPAGLNHVVQVAATSECSLALKDDGSVVAWGSDANRIVSLAPTWSGIKSISAGWYHAIALNSDGSAYAWGYDGSGEVSGFNNVPGPFKQVAAGDQRSVTLSFDGTVHSFGYTGYGSVDPPAGLGPVDRIACCGPNSAAIKSDGSVVIWGSNFYGQCNPPTGWSDYVEYSVGGYHRAAVLANGTVVAAGRNLEGQATVPTGLTGVTKVACGFLHTLALKSTGVVVAWGANFSGESTVPTGLTGVTQIAAGWEHSMALKSNGAVVVWGNNFYGQKNVPSAATSGVTKIAAGPNHCLALKSNGTVVAWGRNDRGQCNVPTGLSGVVQVAAGLYHSVALKSNGTVVCWGDNTYGQCTVPSGLPTITDISAGWEHTAVVTSNLTSKHVVLWGGPYGAGSDMTNVRDGVTKVASGFGSTDFLSPVTVIVSPNPIYQGDAQLFTAYIHGKAPTGGTILRWRVENSIQTGTVPAGATKANFGVTLSGNTAISSQPLWVYKDPVNQDVTSKTYGVGGCYIRGVHTSIASVQVDKPSCLGGDVVQVTVTLPAPAWRDEYLQVISRPAGVLYGFYNFWQDLMIPKGQTTGTVTMYSSTVFDETQISVDATDYVFYQEDRKSTAMTLRPNVIANLTASTTSCIGGDTVTGTVTLAEPTVQDISWMVHLTSSDGSVAAVPDFVTIPKGQSKADFSISTYQSSISKTVQIGAVMRDNAGNPHGTPKSILLTVGPAAVSSVAAPTTIFGLQQASGTVTLNTKAQQDTVVALVAGSARIQVPTLVTVPAGQSSASFSITSSDVTAGSKTTITATLNGSSMKATVSVQPNKMKSFTIAPTAAVGGSTTVVTATVKLTGPVYKALTIPILATAGGTAVNLPATMSVPTGSATGTLSLDLKAVLLDTTVTVESTRLGLTLSASVLLHPNPIVGISTSSSSVIGGSVVSLTGTVTLTAPVSSPVVVALQCNGGAAASVPVSVTVPAGSKTGVFTISHNLVTAALPVSLSATLNGQTVNCSFTVNPLKLATFTITPTTLVGGVDPPALGTVSLPVAMRSDVTVTLTSSSTAVKVPASVLISAGQTSWNFDVTHSKVTAAKTVTVKAAIPGSSKSVSLTVNPG